MTKMPPRKFKNTKMPPLKFQKYNYAPMDNQDKVGINKDDTNHFYYST